MLDGADLHGVGKGLPRQALVLRIFGIVHVEGAFVTGVRSTQMLGELGHRVLAADLNQNLVHVNGLTIASGSLWTFRIAIERSLREISFRERAPLNRIKLRMLLAQIVERLLNIRFRNGNLRFICAQFFVAFEFDFRQYLKRRLKAQRLAVMNVQVGNTRLRHRMDSQPLCLLAEVPRNQRFDDVGLDLFRKALANNRRWNVPAPEARNPGDLLIFLNQGLGFTANFGGRYLDLDLAFRTLFCFCGAHSLPFKASTAAWSRGGAGREWLRSKALYIMCRKHEFKDMQRATSNGRTIYLTHQSNDELLGALSCSRACAE